VAEADDAVVAAERARCAAMLAGDIAALDAQLDPDLSFCHATGQVDGKAAWCAKIAAGRIGYIAIDWPEQQVTPLGRDAALMIGRMATRVRVEGVEKLLDNRVTTVWRRGPGGGWRLLSFQSTPIKG
jgi:ketosteroid isomerase-like protein